MKNRNIREITLGGVCVRYEFERKKVKNINLRVRSDMSVHVSAPLSVPTEVIESFMRSKANFILASLARFGERTESVPRLREYTDGEVFRLLGGDVCLRVLEGSKNDVSSDGEYVYLTVKSGSGAAARERVLTAWLRTVCRERVTAQCREVWRNFAERGVGFPVIKFRAMRSRWGSCQPERGILTFNYALVAAPEECIEYVVLHEFTHFLHPDHSRAFYAELEMLMPDWRKRKEGLRGGDLSTNT